MPAHAAAADVLQALAAEGKQEAEEAAAGVVTLLADLGAQLAEALPQNGGPVAKSVSDVLGADALRRRLGGGLQLDSPQVGACWHRTCVCAQQRFCVASTGVPPVI